MQEKEFLSEPIEHQLARVRRGDDEFLKVLYESKRIRFVNWFQKNYRTERQEAIDLFQNAFSAFYFNVKDGKIVTLKSSIDTYLFGIGKIMMKETFRRESKRSTIEELPELDFADYSYFQEEEVTHDRSIVKSILSKLEEPCKTLLTLYYFKNFSLESIAERMGYKNHGVVKKKEMSLFKNRKISSDRK